MKDEIVKYIDDYLRELKSVRRMSENTLTAYQFDLNEFISFCDRIKIASISNVTEKTARKFIINLSSSGKSATSISRKLSTIRGFFKYLLINEKIDFNPLSAIANPKIKRNLPDTIPLDSLSEIFTLAFSTENEESKAYTVCLIFELLYGCALRVSELCNLNFSDINFENKTIKVLGKGSKVRIIPISEKSIELIRNYISLRNDISYKSPLITTHAGKRLYSVFVYRLVRKYISLVSDVKKKSPHVLRHSAATHLLDNDADLMAVKEILGHENLSTTQIYTHLSVERLKKTYKKAHPKS